MSRWPRGEAQIEQLIANKQLQQVIGGQANGAHLLHKALRTLATASGHHVVDVALRAQFGAELASSASTPELVMDTASWVTGSADVVLFRSGKPDHSTLRLVIRQRQLVDAGEL